MVRPKMQVFRDVARGIGLMARSPLSYLCLTAIQVTVLLVLEGRQVSAMPFSDLEAGFGKNFGAFLDLDWLVDQFLLLVAVFVSNWLFLYLVIMAAARQLTGDAGVTRGFLRFRPAPLVGLFFGLFLIAIVSLVAMIPVSMVLVPVTLALTGAVDAGPGVWGVAILVVVLNTAVTSAVYAVVVAWFIVSPIRDALLAFELPALRDKASLESDGRRRIFLVHFLLTTGVGLFGVLLLYALPGNGVGNSWVFFQCLLAVALPAVASTVAMADVFQAERLTD
jgi:hypothetical protein